jgi:5-methylcytosine-specific restriction endonuclease McrA
MRRASLARVTPLRRTGQLATVTPLHGRQLARVVPLRPVSKKTTAVNRERRAMVTSLWPERPPCTRCGHPADDVHEPLFRSRGGPVTDPANAVPLCRSCHTWAHTHPVEARKAGLAVASWDGGGDAA